MLIASSYQELDEFPAATKAWYANLKSEGKTFRGIFQHCPHILIKGTIFNQGHYRHSKRYYHIVGVNPTDGYK